MSSIKIIEPGGQFRKHFCSLLLFILIISTAVLVVKRDSPYGSWVDAVKVELKSACQSGGLGSAPVKLRRRGRTYKASSFLYLEVHGVGIY